VPECVHDEVGARDELVGGQLWRRRRHGAHPAPCVCVCVCGARWWRCCCCSWHAPAMTTAGMRVLVLVLVVVVVVVVVVLLPLLLWFTTAAPCLVMRHVWSRTANGAPHLCHPSGPPVPHAGTYAPLVTPQHHVCTASHTSGLTSDSWTRHGLNATARQICVLHKHATTVSGDCRASWKAPRPAANLASLQRAHTLPITPVRHHTGAH
jgi:hypothetical protein